ncbi:MAG: flagellar basal body protein [Flavonifractor plautii]
MTKGFYNLTSGILSQSRRLDTVANNMTNLSTSGYKAEQYTDSTFQEVLISRVGNKDKSSPTVIGEESYILAPSQLYVDYSQGSLEETGLTLDFAIEGDAFSPFKRLRASSTPAAAALLDGEGYSACRPWAGSGGGWTTNLSGHRPYPGRSGGNLIQRAAAMWADWVCTPCGQRAAGEMRAACSVRMGRRRLPPRRSSTGNGWRMPTWTCSRR